MNSYRNIAYAMAAQGGLPVWAPHLQEVNGTTAVDLMTAGRGTAFNGTYSGGFTLAQPGPPIAGEVAVGVDLNGTTGFVGTDNAVTSSNSAFTLMTWVRPTSFATNGSFLSITSNTDNQPIVSLGWTNGQISSQNSVVLVARSAGGTNGPNPFAIGAGGGNLSLNTWAHVAGTWDASDGANGTIRVYVNGAQVYSGNPAGGTLSAITLTRTTVGCARRLTNGLFSAGRFAFPMIFPRTLTAAQIAYIYRAGINGVGQQLLSAI